jgi:hypothetical protein
VARTRAQTATAAKKELEIAARNGTLIEKTKVIRALEPLAVLLRNAVLTRADRLERAITTFDPPGSVATFPSMPNPAGAIVGTYFDASNVSHGFLLEGE